MISKTRTKTNLALLCIGVGCIYSSGYAFSLVAGAELKIVMIVLTLIGCWLLSPPKISISIKLGDVRNSVVLFTIIGATLSFVMNPSNTLIDHIILVLRFICALCIASRIQLCDFRKLFVNVMVFLVICSAITWLLVINGINIPAFQYVGIDGVTYRTTWLTTWSVMNPRYMGPFWEPGLFSSFLVIAIVFEGCFQQKARRWWVIILCTYGVILTQSTAGYLLLAMVYVMVLRSNWKGNQVVDAFFIIFFIFLFFQIDSIISILIGFNESIFWKLRGGALTYNTRLLSPVACFQIFLTDPFFGKGITMATNLYNEYKGGYHMDALTSSSGFMLAAFGIWGISYTLGWIKTCLRQQTKPFFVRLVLALLFLMIINKEPHYNNMLTTTIMFTMASSANTTKKN